MGSSIAQSSQEVAARVPAAAPRPVAATLPAAVIALQRTAGNRATRRMLARAMDAEDVAAFERDEHAAVEAFRWRKTAPPTWRRWLRTQAAPLPAAPPPVRERRRIEAEREKLRVQGGGIHKRSHRHKKGRVERIVEQLTEAGLVQVMTMPVARIDPADPAQARTRGVKGASLTNQSTRWNQNPLELQAHIQSPYNVGLLPNVAVPAQAIDSPVTTNTGIRGTGEITKVKRRAWTAGGTLTNAAVRPPTWLAFKSLFHATPAGGRGFIMGHLLNKHLGGLGHDMSNLAPFTYRLNRDHSNLVEQPIKDWLVGRTTPVQLWAAPAAPPVPFGRWVDYKVTPVYTAGAWTNPLSAPGTPVPALALPLSQIWLQIRAWQDQWFLGHPQEAADLLEGLGLIDLTDNAAVATEIANNAWRASALNLNGGVAAPAPITLQQVAARVDDFFAWYLATHFPTQIECRVRLYEVQGGGGVAKSQTLEVTLPNQL